MNNKIIHLNDKTFEKIVLQDKELVLVDFWAEWCNPCKRLDPILEDIANEFKNKLTFAKVNINDNPDTVSKYAIQSIPNLLLFKNGKMIANKIGSLSKEQVKDFLNQNLQ